MPRRLFISAGEASGDRHAAAVVRALRERLGDIEVRGLGGDALQAEGAQLLAHVRDLSVIGFAEVARRLPYFWKLFHRVRRDIDDWKPDAVIPVDYPGFNLRLARTARRRGHRVVYYIAPQVWAWRKDRRPGIARAVDQLLVVFPFEEPLFREAGIPTTFVGHPLVDATGRIGDPGSVRADLGLAPDAPFLALLPGSRRQEVSSILPTLLQAAQRLRSEGVNPVVSRAPGLPDALFAAADEASVPVWTGPAGDLAASADAAVVASGTATLETGLLGTPLVVVYRTGRINWELAKHLVKIRTVGLVNIAAGGDTVPELLQDDLTADGVAETARRLLFDHAERARQKEYLARLPERLGAGNAAERAAEAIATSLESRS